MNNDNFLIEDSDLDLAKSICNTIDDSNIRNRAVANALASDIAGKYFTEVEADTESGLHRIAAVLDKLDIADIYVKDSYIDVRLYFEDGNLCIPKEHFDRNILPVAYMFIKLDSDLSNGLVTGFVLPNAVNRSIECNGYYKVSEEELISYYDVEALLVQNYSEDSPENFEKMVFDYLDGKLEDENGFYRALIASRYCRNFLKNAANVKTIFNYVSITKDKSSETPVEKGLAIGASESSELVELNSESSEEMSLDFNFDGQVESLEEFDTEQEIEEFEEVEQDVFELSADEPVELEETEELMVDDGEVLSLDVEESSIQEESFNVVEGSIEEDANMLEEVAPASIEADLVEIEESPTAPESVSVIEESVEPEITTAIVEEVQEASVDSSDLSEAPVENYSTNVTPSIDTIEQDEDASIDELQALLENDRSVFDEEQEDASDAAVTTEIEAKENENTPQIEELFGDENYNQEQLEAEFIQPAKKNSSKVVPLIGVLALVGALGYFGYTKFVSQENTSMELPESSQMMQQPDVVAEEPVQTDAMPLETVENVNSPKPTNEGNDISIPAIEQSLDASIVVSNLSINWEVPAGYLTNNTAKRYFTKMGKIIQLNLKTELLLLSKPPITNKIMVELEYNKNNKKFDVKGITASSGEKVVDDVILQTVKKALDINLKTNLSSFGTIAGNPVLIIRL